MKLYPLTQATHHSKLMLWIAWAIIILVGLSFIGYKATERRHVIKAAQVPSKEAALGKPMLAQNLPSTSQLLSYLQSLQVLAPVGATGQVVLLLPVKAPVATPTSSPNTSAVSPAVVPETAPLSDVLWVKGQKQMLLAQGTSSAGVDLSLLKASDIDLAHMTIRLPPAQIFATQVDTITAYDTASGQKATMQFGLLRPDTEIADAQQQLAQQACTAGVLQAATDAAAKQVITLLRLMSLNVKVESLPPTPCAGISSTAVAEPAAVTATASAS